MPCFHLSAAELAALLASGDYSLSGGPFATEGECLAVCGSSSTSAIPGCCATDSPAQWLVIFPTITNDICTGCSALSGAHILTYAGTDGLLCYWQKNLGSELSCGDDPSIYGPWLTLTTDGTFLNALFVFDLEGVTDGRMIYQGINQWLCMGPNVLDYIDDNDWCLGLPLTVTLTAV